MLKHLLKQPKQSELQEIEHVKFLIILKIAYFALAVHVVLIPVFAHIGAVTLAIVNVLSVCAWAGGIFLIKQGLTSLALRVFCLEVVIHSTIVCAMLGLDAGFQFYLWTVSCLLMIDYQLTLKRASLYSVLMIIAFALLYVFFSNTNYPFAYSELLPHIKIINIIIAGLPMIYGMGFIREITLSQRLELTEMAARDPLTKLFNRRFAKKRIMNARESGIMNNSPLCMAMADIDQFKRINDNYGHDKGDTILVNISRLISEFMSEDDIAVRWGGEEFLLILTQSNERQAFAKIEALRTKIAALEAHPDCPDLKVTMSFGLIEWQPLTPIEKMLQYADSALYESKHSGRNKTTIVHAQSTFFENED